MIVNVNKISSNYGCSAEVLSRHRAMTVEYVKENQYVINILEGKTRRNIDNIKCRDGDLIRYLVHYARKYIVPRENIALCEELKDNGSSDS